MVSAGFQWNMKIMKNVTDELFLFNTKYNKKDRLLAFD